MSFLLWDENKNYLKEFQKAVIELRNSCNNDTAVSTHHHPGWAYVVTKFLCEGDYDKAASETVIFDKNTDNSYGDSTAHRVGPDLKKILEHPSQLLKAKNA